MLKKAVIPLLCTALVLCASGLLIQHRRTAAAEHTLQETYARSLGEACEGMQSLSLDLEKLLISRDQEYIAQLLDNISRRAEDVRLALAHLPLGAEDLTAVMTFTGQMAQRCAQMLSEVVQSDFYADSHRASLQKDLAHCRLIAGHLASVQTEILSGRLLLQHAVPDFSPLPAATAPQNAKGLPPSDVTLGQAMSIATEFVGRNRALDVSASSHVAGGNIPAWGVQIKTADLLLNLEVTRKGGKVLLMSPETAGFEALHSQEECIAAAQNFLQSRNFSSMETVWSQSYDGLCVVTFVSVQEGILIYPDLLSVQVRMDTTEVVGLEARQYWLHHTPRRLPSPALTKSEAQSRLSEDVTVFHSRLCIIPSDEGETLCWEFTVTSGDETFLIYIDAQTGREAALQKIVMLENGAMAA